MDEYNNLPRWFQRIIPLISVIFSILAFSYVIYLYSQESLEFVQWIRLIIFTIIGVVLLFSAIIYVFHAELAWKSLIGGLGLLPILLLLQLFLFLMTVIRMAIESIFQGSLPEPIQLFIENYPSTFDIVILSVLFIIGLLWIIDKLRKK
ncbi:hypothetical protein KFZ56_18940 [Virgibacillus sp. NKC19-3]|uniref:hypothetical protein n=1 Tax=Virgibacillus saliphilus TaxID=2831674 RepID=UPI001C9A4E87|nr:hypothetical protein [Virgibacillus sp. NKC19-3]MBY7145098.1 hypothetical protein [Virgibacillus sp. NKC19-3]